MDEILKMRDEIDFNNLTYSFKGPTSSVNFGKFGDPMYIYCHTKNGDTILQEVEKLQNHFKKELNEITSRNPNHKINNHSYVIENFKNLYNSRQKTMDLLNDNSRIRSEAIYK